jgi:hypothetical protein
VIPVYVKKFSSYGLWVDGDECASVEPVETLIKKMEENLRAFAECEIGIEGGVLDSSPQMVELPELVKEVILYHAKYKPQEYADYVFHKPRNNNRVEPTWGTLARSLAQKNG